jgi:CO/xanthine dehydrogenase FAD-binding subunit
MKPAPFDYYDPSTVEEALSLLREHGGDAKILAGGQSLLPALNMRLAKPALLVDINTVSGLDYIRSENGHVTIGALTRHRTVEISSVLRELCPIFCDAAPTIGDVQVRNRGTFGGSLAHADPAAQFCALVYTLGGKVIARRFDATRTIAIEDFFLGPLTTALEPTEMISEVRVPALQGPGWSVRSIQPRHGDFVIAGVAVVLDMKDGMCQEARVGLYGVGPTPLRARQAEEKLRGERLADRLFTEVAETAAREAEPVSDVQASAEYRRAMVRWLAEWNLKNARDRLAQGGDL